MVFELRAFSCCRKNKLTVEKRREVSMSTTLASHSKARRSGKSEA